MQRCYQRDTEHIAGDLVPWHSCGNALLLLLLLLPLLLLLLLLLLLAAGVQCDMNLHTKGFIGGQSNSSPLTARGRQQAAALGSYLARLYPSLPASPQQLLHSSTAVRAADTAALLLQQFLQAEPRCGVAASPALLELSQGRWEGQPRAACYTPEVLAAIANDPWTFAAPGGESQKQLEGRMASYINEAVLPELEYDGLPALVVTHGLAIKCFLRHVLGSTPGMTWKIQLDNTAITEVSWCAQGPGAGWHLGRVNDVTHLALAGLLHPLQLQLQAAGGAAHAGAAGSGAASGGDADPGGSTARAGGGGAAAAADGDALSVQP